MDIIIGCGMNTVYLDFGRPTCAVCLKEMSKGWLEEVQKIAPKQAAMVLTRTREEAWNNVGVSYREE